LAILHRHAGVATHDQDVFVNAVGGLRISETGSDLALIMSVLSSLKNRPLSSQDVVFGEVGLSGEIRPVPGGQERLKEAQKHGFKRAIVPKANAPKSSMEGLEVIAIEKLSELLQYM
ncbi:MAG: DNA repair protein RadA, partial [Coxiellaceae bacterium]|nr:DNA repair protein RadA [Coxiellaceae bacterium]